MGVHPLYGSSDALSMTHPRVGIRQLIVPDKVCCQTFGDSSAMLAHPPSFVMHPVSNARAMRLIFALEAEPTSTEPVAPKGDESCHGTITTELQRSQYLKST